MFCAVTLRKLAIELTWFAQIPFLASFTPSPVWNKNNCTNSWENKQKTIHYTTQKCGTNPVDEDIFRQTRVWILDLAESVHHFSTIQLLNQLLQSSIWCRKVVENLNSYCGRLCNCGYFFPLRMTGLVSRGMQFFCADFPVLQLYADGEIPAHIWLYYVEIIKT